MKKIIFLLAITFVSANLYAQGPVNFGPKIGYTSSKIKTDMKGINEEIKNGFEIGAFVRVKLKKFYLQPELYYAIKGGALDTANLTQEIQLNTLDIPILFGYKVIGKDAFNFRLFVGPVASFIVNKTIKLNGDKLNDDLVDNSIKDAIWGLQMGAGVDFLMFTLDVRYELGLNDINSDDTGAEFKSNTFHVSLGWKIL